MTLRKLAEIALKESLKQGAVDISAICSEAKENQVRFSNNSITVNNNIRNVELFLYVSKDRKRIAGTTSNPSVEGIEKFTSDLIKACEALASSPDYTPLPKMQTRYFTHGIFDRKVAEVTTELVDFVKEAIYAGLAAGAKRVSGSLIASEEAFYILTSGGADSEDRRTKIMLNVRAFADDIASGQGLSCAARLDDFSASDAGRVAGEYAKESLNPGPWDEGIYDLIMMPTVASEIIQHIGAFASAFSIDSGLSFLAEKIGQKVAHDELTLRDFGVVEGGFEGRGFDDEGIPTSENIIIKKGVLRGYLHNSTTAKKFNTASTGNAGIINPHPWNLVVDSGTMGVDEMIKEVNKGMLVTSNWYTRFQNLRAGEFSTIPRDAAFMIENGRIKHSVTGIRISDSLPRQLLSISAISKERKWVKWWEVRIPTLCPAMLVRDVTISKAVG